MARVNLFGVDISKHLLRDEGEVVVDEVTHHWVSYIKPVAYAILGLALMIVAATIDMNVAWIIVLLAFGLVGYAFWRALVISRDRFVVTNMRIFRVHGVLSSELATMPLARVLDITVKQSFTGQIFNYGHFVFESAAQEQGLNNIYFVGRPTERDLTIQRVVQRAGLRGSVG